MKKPSAMNRMLTAKRGGVRGVRRSNTLRWLPAPQNEVQEAPTE